MCIIIVIHVIEIENLLLMLKIKKVNMIEDDSRETKVIEGFWKDWTVRTGRRNGRRGDSGIESGRTDYVWE